MIGISEKTIASISSALSKSGVGIIRISGDEAISIVSKIFKTKDKKDIDINETHRIKYGYIYDSEKNLFIDEVLVLTFKAPRSFTKEDVVEIQAHGGVFLLQKILDLVLKNGATLAEPGEFTKRAFLNGRIDLSQAEAVMDLINSESDMAIQSSLSQLKGNIKNKISNFKKELLEYTAFIEACLDDPEHLDIEGYKYELRNNLEIIIKEINDIIDNYENGKIIKEGIKTVILGKPNVGKSSLLNLLLNENRAIVTNIAGTTRDIIKETINLDGITLHIIDTAGIRYDDNIDEVEKIGIDKAKEEAIDADLILLMIDATTNFDDFEKKLLEEYNDKKMIILLNKIDLKKDFNLNLDDKKIIKFSTYTKEGFDELKNTIRELFIKSDLDFNNQIYISNKRQLQNLIDAKQSLLNVIQTIDDEMPEDLFTIDLMDGIKYLSQILGEDMTSDLADTIFSKFCMGK